MRKRIEIKSTDNTDVILFIDAIDGVVETKKGAKILLKSGVIIETGASFLELKTRLIGD